MRRGLVAGMIGAGGVAAVLTLVWLGRGQGGSAVPDPVHVSTPRAKQNHQERQAVAVVAPTSGSVARSDPEPPASGPDVPTDEMSPELEEEQKAGAAWQSIDLDEVRKAMPDNLYWKLSSPTKDPQVQEERDEERARWNVQYGKIVSGTASEEEIRAFYDHRARLSGDYIEFTTYLLDHYGDRLAERDVSLIKLARRLHLARIEEVPRKIEQAFERKRAQDAARERWLADQAIFGAPEPDAGGGGDSNPE